MSTYFFLLGSTPLLSAAELSAVCGDKEVTQFSSRLRSVEFSDDKEAQDVFNSLGGSIKLYKVEKTYKTFSKDSLIADITSYLANLGRKPHFSFMQFGMPEAEVDTRDIKNELKKQGIGSRYTEQSGETGVSAAILLHQPDVVEFATIEGEEASYLVRTIGIQDIDDWTKRDRHKPYFDRKKGMLPPKVARIMVNIGLGMLAKSKNTPVLYDPFCGTGTVLIEGLIRKCSVIGSDLDKNAVAGSIDNLNWMKDEYSVENSFDVFKSDVSRVKKTETFGNIDIIVTEPFLGKPNPKEQQLSNIFKGLEKLYLGAFNAWVDILMPGAVVVIVFPLVQATNKTFSLEKLIDKLATKGYTPLVTPPLMYARPRAVVQRQIQVFRFDPK